MMNAVAIEKENVPATEQHPYLHSRYGGSSFEIGLESRSGNFLERKKLWLENKFN